MVRCRLRSWKAWITASPRASEVMKSGSPVSASIRRAGEAMIAGAWGTLAERDGSDMGATCSDDDSGSSPIAAVEAKWSVEFHLDTRRSAVTSDCRGGPGPPLQQRPGVIEDQPVFVDVGAVVGAGGDVAQADVQILQRAALHGVANIQIPLPLLALEAQTGIDVIAPDIAHRGRQTRYTQRSEVVVVA